MLSDRQRQLVFIDDRLNGAAFGIEEYSRNAGGCQSHAGEALRIWRPWHDVYPFPAQLVDDGLHPTALEAHAGPNRIDGVVLADHGDLRPGPHFASGRADLDDVLLNFRHFQFEERAHEAGIGPRQNQTWSPRCLFEPFQDRPNGIALVKMLPAVLFPVRYDGFRFAKLVEHDHQLAAVDLLDLARQEFPDLTREFVPNA